MRDSDRTYYDPEQYGRRRDDVTGVWGRIAAVGMKYNWLVTLFFALMLALGFGFRTPRDAFSEIHKSIDELKATVDYNKTNGSAAVDSLRDKLSATEYERAQLKQLIESSITAQCLYYPSKVSRSSGLPCARLFRERGIE